MLSHEQELRVYRRDSLARADAPAVAGRSASDAVRVLVVDDDGLVRDALATVLREHGYFVGALASPEEALAAVRIGHYDLIFLDVFFPAASALDYLGGFARAAPHTPIILLSGCADTDVVRRALAAGAADYVTKPWGSHELPIIVERNLARRDALLHATLAHRHQLQVSYESVLDALLTALDTRNTETEGHSERVTAYTMVLADVMGVPSEELYHIERGALLHDIGKIGVPDRVLLKPGPLDEEEWAEMRKHPVVGYGMCRRIDFLAGAAMIVLHHHERWDGKGYPEGIKGSDIHPGARMFSVVDAYDAMTTDRPYRQAFTDAQARAEIARCSGTQFDPDVVAAFLSIPAARLVELREQLAR